MYNLSRSHRKHLPLWILVSERDSAYNLSQILSETCTHIHIIHMYTQVYTYVLVQTHGLFHSEIQLTVKHRITSHISLHSVVYEEIFGPPKISGTTSHPFSPIRNTERHRKENPGPLNHWQVAELVWNKIGSVHRTGSGHLM